MVLCVRKRVTPMLSLFSVFCIVRRREFGAFFLGGFPSKSKGSKNSKEFYFWLHVLRCMPLWVHDGHRNVPLTENQSTFPKQRLRGAYQRAFTLGALWHILTHSLPYTQSVLSFFYCIFSPKYRRSISMLIAQFKKFHPNHHGFLLGAPLTFLFVSEYAV